MVSWVSTYAKCQLGQNWFNLFPLSVLCETPTEVVIPILVDDMTTVTEAEMGIAAEYGHGVCLWFYWQGVWVKPHPDTRMVIAATFGPLAFTLF